MKVAYHFNADDPLLGRSYGWAILASLFSTILVASDLHIRSQISYGDMLLRRFAHDVDIVPDGRTLRSNWDELDRAIEVLLDDNDTLWSTFAVDKVATLRSHNIFVVVFGNLSRDVAEKLDAAMTKQPYYVGAMQVDAHNPLHDVIYEHSLVRKLRMNGTKLRVLVNGADGDLNEDGFIHFLRKLAFTSVKRKIIWELPVWWGHS